MTRVLRLIGPGLAGLGPLVACEAIQDPLGETRRVAEPYDRVRVATPIGIAFSLPTGLERDEVHVMCADGPESAVRTRIERQPDGPTLVVEAEPGAERCVVTLCVEAPLDLVADTPSTLELTTQQVIRLGSIEATSVLLHTSVAGAIAVDAVAVRDVTLDARGASAIDVGRVSAELLTVRTDGSAQAAVRDAEVGVWEVDAWGHALQIGAGVADHVAITAGGDARIQMRDVSATSAEIALSGAAAAWIDVDPDHAKTEVEDAAVLKLGG